MNTRVMTCVNRNCCKPMNSLSEGRLFHFEILSISISADDDSKKDWDEIPHREAIQFWLCGLCASSMTLQLKPIGGVHLLPLDDSPEPDLRAKDSAFTESIEALQQN